MYRTDLICEEFGSEDKVTINKEDFDKYHKREGDYYTISTEAFINNDYEEMKKIEENICKVIKDFIDVKKKALVIGLGNYTITPDSLGPRACENIVASSHLKDENLGNLSVIAPGVMGQTGMETSDIIKGIIDKTKPDYLIVIDALAARSIKRLNQTIQITDAGINPGSGVGNKRKEISMSTMGIPVIAIGIPTVVDLSSIAYDSIEYLLKHLELEKNKNGLRINDKEDYDSLDLSKKTEETYLGLIGKLTNTEQKNLINEALTPSGYNYLVTPKSIDEDISSMALVISRGINMAFHKLEQNMPS